MAQHDYVIANQSGSAFRADLNNALSATVTGNSGSSAPSTTYAYMIWNDTTSNQRKIRNSANNAWIVLSTLSGGNVFDDDVTFNGASYNLVWDKSDNALEFADNAKCTFGNGDLEIYHDGTNNLILGSPTVLIKNKANSESYIRCNENAEVSLFHDGSKKFETWTSGARLPADNSVLAIGAGDDLRFWHNATNSIIRNDTGNLYLRNAGDYYLQVNGGSNENAIVAGTNGAVKLYYDNSKKFSTYSAGVLLGDIDSSSTTGSGIVGNSSQFVHKHPGTGDHDFNEFFRGTDGSQARVGYIRTNGSSTTYSTSSDYRLKENEVVISDGITRLKTLKPYRFNFKVDPDTTVDGFFAHEVTPAVPEAITGEKDGTEMQGIDQSKLVPLLTAALQEAITKIETLETKVAALEAK